MEELLTLLRRIDKRLEHIEMLHIVSNALLSSTLTISSEQSSALEARVKAVMETYHEKPGEEQHL